MLVTATATVITPNDMTVESLLVRPNEWIFPFSSNRGLGLTMKIRTITRMKKMEAYRTRGLNDSMVMILH